MSLTRLYLIDCPRCGNGRLLRSRSRWYEKLIQFTGRIPFRCYDCGHRFVGPTGPHMSVDSEAPVSEKVQAHCPNCERYQSIFLSGAEMQVANAEGWLVSCASCHNLYVGMSPSESDPTEEL